VISQRDFPLSIMINEKTRKYEYLQPSHKKICRMWRILRHRNSFLDISKREAENAQANAI